MSRLCRFLNLVFAVAVPVIVGTSASVFAGADSAQFDPGGVWRDTGGNPINAHGGCILFHNGVYYWYGEAKAGRKEVEEAEHIRITGGIAPDKQIQLALFLASERANHISGKLIYVTDDWKRFERDNMKPEMYTLRRMQRG